MSTSNLPTPVARDFPPDILREIFLSCVAARRSETSALDVPWVLGHICRYWREEALSTPLLWNQLPKLTVTEANGNLRSLPMYQELIRRSGDAELILEFKFELNNSKIPPLPYPILKQFTDHSDRWGRLAITGLNATEMMRQFNNARKRFARLHHLKIIFPTNISRGVRGKLTGEPFDLFEIAPALSNIMIYTSGAFIKSEPRFAYENLKDYREFGLGYGAFSHLLRSSPRLRTFLCTDDLEYKPQLSVTHYHLRHLNIQITLSPVHFLQSLAEVSLPALEVLVVDSTEAGQPNPSDRSVIPDIVALLSRSKCELQTLIIWQKSISDKELKQLFPLINDLKELGLGDCSAGIRKALTDLALNKNNHTPLPHLRYLRLHYNNEIRPSEAKAIQRLVKSRERTMNNRKFSGRLHSPLKYIRLRISNADHFYHTSLILNDWADPLRDRYTAQAGDVFTPDVVTVENFRRINQMTNTLVSQQKEKGRITEKFEQGAIVYLFLTHIFVQKWKEQIGSHRLLAEVSKYQREITWLLFGDEDDLNSVKWIAAGENNLLFVYPDHPLRQSQEKRSSIIYGIEDSEDIYSLEGYHLRDLDLLEALGLF